MANTLELTIVTPEKKAFEGRALSVVIPAFDGEMGIEANHAAIISLLGDGELRVKDESGSTQSLAVNGGFLQVRDNSVTVLTQASIPAKDLDAAVIQKELETLGKEPPKGGEALEVHNKQISWAKARLKVAQKAQ